MGGHPSTRAPAHQAFIRSHQSPPCSDASMRPNLQSSTGPTARASHNGGRPRPGAARTTWTQTPVSSPPPPSGLPTPGSRGLTRQPRRVAVHHAASPPSMEPWKA
nr:MAG TPA: hypothetical protein [Caudoviricetes sp.]